MKLCPFCKTQNESDAKFCTNCGHKFESKILDSTPVLHDSVAEKNISQKPVNKKLLNKVVSSFKQIGTFIKEKFKSKKFVARFSITATVAIALIIICSVVLYRPNPESVTLSSGYKTIDIKDNTELQLNISPAKFSSKSFQCISSNTKVATASFDKQTNEIKICPHSEGTTVIKIKYTSIHGHSVASNEVTYAVIDKTAKAKQAAAVDQQIASIGKPSLKHAQLITKASNSYLDLTDYAKGLVKNKSTLDAAEEALSKEAAVAAQPVIKSIDSLGTVDKNSATKISAARTLYNSLPDAVKSSVSNYDTLVSAESSLKAIQDKEKQKAAEAKEISNFKASCSSYSYKSIARDPDTYNGKNAKFTGKVVQVMDDLTDVVLRVNVTKDEYGIWTDTVYVTYSNANTSSRILENDVITMYGTLNGLETYTSTLGASITIPSFDAKYIDIQ